MREVVKEPPRAIAEKAIDRVDEQSRLFLEASPFFLLATTAPDGGMDVSPRGDPPGSVLVLDDGRSLAFGDRKGNRRLDSLRNILANPRVGMIFLIPGINDTLRVNGRAEVIRDAPYFDRLAVQGKRPELAIEVRIEELFLHCAKAFLRSSLWETSTWPDRSAVPSAGRIAKSQAGSKVPESLMNAALRLDSKFRRY
ncbi:MSMEG_1061 family FMN-dependent PPOX-type flavoprotein [Nocardiopsis composta]